MTHTQLEHAPLPEDSLQDVTDVQGLRRREEDQGHPTVVDHEVRSTISEDGIILRTPDAHHHLQSGKDWRLQTVQDMIDLVHRLEEDILLPATSLTTIDQDLEHHHDVMIAKQYIRMTTGDDVLRHPKFPGRPQIILRVAHHLQFILIGLA
jgi:hypothetical protein